MSAIDKVLRNSGAKLQVVFYADGVAIDADGSVTYVASDPWGDEVDSGTATQPGPTGTYEFVLAPQSDLKLVTIVWSGTFSTVAQTVTTYAEIVGNNLYTVSDARSFRPQGSPPVGLIADDAKYPTSAIVDHREETTELFTVLLGYSPVEASTFVAKDGTGEEWIYVDPEINKILRVDIDGETVTDDLIVHRYGKIILSGGWPSGNQNVQLHYEHGLKHTPAPISRAALVMLHSLILGSDVMDRTVTHTDETGTYRLAVPDMYKNRSTGIPFVDSTIANYAFSWSVV